MTTTFTNFHIFVSKDLNPAMIDTVPTNTPSELASLWGDYTIKSGQLTGLGFGAGVRYSGISYADTANTLVVPSYLVGDAAIGGIADTSAAFVAVRASRERDRQQQDHRRAL